MRTGFVFSIALIPIGLCAAEPAHGPNSKLVNPREHWAYQPLKAIVPVDLNSGLSEIDRFIGAKLTAEGLNFAGPADARTLIRRASYDLTGLPPTLAEVAEFEKEFAATPQAAYEKLLDRLLASPQYGETQARRWLDLARYADTKGYVFTEDRNYPYAYTYRDWLIRAFNEDMPYSRFVELQIAADRLQPTDSRDLAAMGFMTVGRRFLNNIHDIIDDRLDVTSRTFLGMTLACARCHDHKYDPIPAKDYYSLYGVFASSIEPAELPLIGEVLRTPESAAFEKELQKKQDEVEALTQKLLTARIEKLRQPASIAAYLLAVRAVGGKPNDKVQPYLRERELNAYVLNRWRDHLNQQGNRESPLFDVWRTLATIPDADFAAKAPDVLSKATDPLIVKAFAGQKAFNAEEAAGVYGKLLATEPSLLVKGGPLDIPLADADKVLDRDELNKKRDLQKKADAFKATSPHAPPRAMVLHDAASLTNPYVFTRGNPGNRGPAVPRQFLEVLSTPERKPFINGSGRLEMAKAITDPKNPLTARVMVNRLWIEHFGYGLVRTPSDFGLRSDPPTHPELLDYLASQFIESGWSIKKMHRLIMISKGYRQSSEVSAELIKRDPENRLLAHMNRRRLDFEAMRDSLLFVAGRLDSTMNGKAVDLFKEPFSTRRTVYGFIDRQNLPGTFRVFDFASPDQHSPQRFKTTVPQQALFLMNSPFVLEQAKKLVARPEVATKNAPPERIEALSRLIYGRAARPDEAALAAAFVGQSMLEVSWEQLAQAMLLSNEFAFID